MRPDNHPWASFCAGTAGRFIARVQMAGGSGGYFYAAYGDWYDYDPYFEYANVYLQASSELWEAIVFYNVGGYDSYVAGLAAGAAADWCYWAWLF